MAVEYILSTDKLQSGFRAKYNFSVAEIITGFIDQGNGTVNAVQFDATTLPIDLTTSFFTKSEIIALFAGIPTNTVTRVEFTASTNPGEDTIDLSAESIPAFPTYVFYPTAGGPAQPGDFDPDTQIVSGLSPDTEYLCVFIG